jgi:hypothetical protein
MSYYLLPKKSKIPELKFEYDGNIEQIVSFSLSHYLDILNKTLHSKKIEIDLNSLQNAVNPYTFLYSVVDETNLSVSKINSTEENFFSFLEILHLFGLFEKYNSVKVRLLINCNDSYYSNIIDKLKPEKCCRLNTLKGETVEGGLYNILYFETTSKEMYLNELLSILFYINCYQEKDGDCIIKIDTLYHTPILQMVYFLTSMFENVYIIKPHVSFIFNDDRYLVCKQFIRNVPSFTMPDESKVSSMINEKLPVYFLNKIEDSNIIIGHTQLEYYDQLVNIIKHKNPNEKIETIRKNNIQKCILWCEKLNIPCNKFIDKLNIFLNQPEELHLD